MLHKKYDLVSNVSKLDLIPESTSWSIQTSSLNKVPWINQVETIQLLKREIILDH